jgi:peptidoglycan/LPS O-acetylase OafA/YrhL
LLLDIPLIIGGGVSFYHAYLAVDLFFMLSGFVVSHAYDRKLTSKKMSFWRFFLTRIIRLYPLYLLAALISALVFVPKNAFLQGDINTIIEYITALFFTLFYLPYKVSGNNSLFTINGVTWSLFFELIINMIYAISRPFLSINRLKFIVMISGLYLAIQAILLDGIDYGYLWDWKALLIGTARATFGFSCGLLLHRIWLLKPTVSESTKNSILLLMLACISLGFVNISQLNGLIDCLSILIIFPFCVFLSAKTNPEKRALRLFELLGIISYPIYLLHDSLGAGIAKATKLVGYDVEKFAPYSGFLLVASLILLSLLLDRFYDHPVRRYLLSIVSK